MDKFFMILGFTGQAMFSGRFLVQWIASEKKKKSVFPHAFWTLSILGSLILLIYAIYKRSCNHIRSSIWSYCLHS